MNPNRIQLGIDISPLAAGAQVLSPPEVAAIVRSALMALEHGADYIRLDANVPVALRSALVSLAGRSLLLDADMSSAAQLLKDAQLPALVNLVGVESLAATKALAQTAQAAGVELMLAVTDATALTLEGLPAEVAGLSLDARFWATASQSRREAAREQIEHVIEAADEHDLFVHLTHLPTATDAEEAAIMGGVAGIELGRGWLPLALDVGLPDALSRLKHTLVDAQQAALAIALEEHDHHQHDCGHDHSPEGGCDCHH